MSTVHIHAPPAIERSIRWVDCLDCKKRSPFAILSYDYYGPSACCMRCGRRYQEGEWCALDFCRNSRKANRDSMRAAWKRAAP